MADAATIQTRITELESRIAAFAGVKSTTFGDQRTDFDYEAAKKELASLHSQLAAANAKSRTRVASISKGF